MCYNDDGMFKVVICVDSNVELFVEQSILKFTFFSGKDAAQPLFSGEDAAQPCLCRPQLPRCCHQEAGDRRGES